MTRLSHRALKIISIFPLLVNFSCRRPPEHCADFKTGKFEYYYVSDDVRNKISVTRTDSFQIETYHAANMTVKLRIVWNNDCEYTLYPMLDDNRPHNSRDSFFSTKGMKVTITETTRSHYIYTSRLDSAGRSVTNTDTLWRVGR